jgi:hypothetical protein
MPVLNDYAVGGYLIFRGVRPFIDGRANMYRDDFLAGYAATMRPDRARLIATLEAHGIQWTILGPASLALDVLDRLAGWHRLYQDREAVVHASIADADDRHGRPH